MSVRSLVAAVATAAALAGGEEAQVRTGQRCEVAAVLRGVAETFAEVPDGRNTTHTHTHFGCWPTCSIRLTGVDPFLKGACGTPGMARTFGTCEGDTRDRMVRTRSGDGAGIAASSRESGNDPAVVVQDSTSQG